jgi:ribokinase
MPYVVVVGSLNMDLVVRVPRMPAPGETIFGSDFQTFPGGKGANQAVAAARLGAQVTMIGRVGADAFGERLLANLKTEDVDVTHVQSDQEAATGIAMITVDESGQNSIIVASGANMQLTPQDVATAWRSIEQVDVVVMPLEVSLPCIEQAARLAGASGARVVLNPAPAQHLSDDLLRRVDLLAPNESETALLTQMAVNTIEQAEQAARALQAKGVGAVVLTLGSRGALLLDGESPGRHLPAHTVEVLDTTAAGDAFVAALAVGLAEGASLDKAARLANAAGALAVTRMGAQPAMPTRTEVDQLLQQR